MNHPHFLVLSRFWEARRALALFLAPCLALVVLDCGTTRAAQSPPAAAPSSEPAARQANPHAPPIHPNPACPIMGKPISSVLHVDTELGRFYVCCKACYADILADVPAAYAAAYPHEQRVANARCPLTGAQLDARSPRVRLQGFDFAVRDEPTARRARAHAQLALVRLHGPELVDLENALCPITGTPVAANAFALIEGTIVHLSSPKLLAEVAAAPAQVLAKARSLPRASGLPTSAPASAPTAERPRNPAAERASDTGAR
jgi:hypothetical protein